jgi:carboxypeptidase B
MMRSVALVVAVLAVAAIAAPRIRYDGHRVYRLTLQPDQLAVVNAMPSETFGLDWWREPMIRSEEVTTADVRVPPSSRAAVLDWFLEHGINASVMIEDVELTALHSLASGDSADWFTAYHDYNATVDWLKTLVLQNPSRAKLVTIGTSYEGRTIYGVQVLGAAGDVHNAAKPKIFYDGGIHAREWIAPATVQYILYQLITLYGKDATVTRLVDNIDWTICPIFNTDGYQYTWSRDRMWRKTRKPNQGSSCVGTDPCRNSDNHWCGLGASTNPCSDTFCGSAPFDQPEVKAIATYVKGLGNVQGYINFHSYSQLWMSPWSYDYVVPPEPDKSLQANLNKAATDAIRATHGLTYRYGPGATTIYPASGDIGDYLYAAGVRYSTCVELRDTGRYGFLLPPEQIIPTGEEIWAAAKVMGQYILDHP